MATTKKLQLNFAKSNGNNISFAYSNIASNPSSANVKLLMEGMVANGAIFQNQPASIRSAKFIETSTTDIDLS